MGADAGRVPPICERPGDLFRISQLLSRTGLDAAAARPGRIAAIAMVPGCNFSSADGGQVLGDDSTDRLRSCLRTGALYRRMDRGNRCSRPVPRRDYTAEAALLQAVARERCSNASAAATDVECCHPTRVSAQPSRAQVREPGTSPRYLVPAAALSGTRSRFSMVSTSARCALMYS